MPQPAIASRPNKPQPARGEVWLVDLNEPPRGREEGGKNRPALVLSVDRFNQGPAELVIVLPLSSRAKGIASHVQINPPEGGVKTSSFIKCEAIRSVSKDRLTAQWGTVSARTLETVENIIRTLLALP